MKELLFSIFTVVMSTTNTTVGSRVNLPTTINGRSVNISQYGMVARQIHAVYIYTVSPTPYIQAIATGIDTGYIKNATNDTIFKFPTNVTP